jgi:hypothetical protein
MVGLVLQSIIMAAVQVTLEDQKCRGHIIVTMRNHGTSLIEREDLSAKDILGRQSLDARKLEAQALRAAGRRRDAGGELFEVN